MHIAEIPRIVICVKERLPVYALILTRVSV